VKLTVGSVPLQALLITVTDGRDQIDLTPHEGQLVLELVSPEGQAVSTSGGTLSVREDGKALFAWPPTTLFPTAGDYKLRVRVSGSTVLDWTTTEIIEVYPLGVAL
jgi:hypothetical protein